ncbi:MULTISPECIES: YlbG family protein [Aerococcus]|uniref:YlbG family protein n=1 Tax=Aerococcus TaxID=1375 RepID=UPI000A61A5DC|nr:MULTISPECIES: YlbG family protein [Aerococcus]MDK6369736.1 YlbG family protein [Aerococcus sp. UMB9870]MDK6680376.1 YlbG family protein [Aerococcus sp. UMB8608]MDK6686955.1 YlbG family protein [Aerococcus sp. UMB8623]MDK6940067.1 YlbG family protein [Aerococcus sp. UMB8487]
MAEYDKRQDRAGLIVWLHSTKHTRPLQKYGYVYYISYKLKYAVVYTPVEDLERTMQKISKLKFVRQVDESPRQEINTQFDQVLGELKERMPKDDGLPEMKYRF